MRLMDEVAFRTIQAGGPGSGRHKGTGSVDLAEYSHPSLAAMVPQFERIVGHPLHSDNMLKVARAITSLDNGKPRTPHYAEALQYASQGKGDPVEGLKQAQQEKEPSYRGGGPTPIATRALEVLKTLK
jgi:hypothetical protein